MLGWKLIHVATCLQTTLCILRYQVFAFGKNNADQAGVPGIEEVPEPREIYSGKGKYSETCL